MSDNRLLAPIGQCELMPGYEKPFPIPKQYQRSGLIAYETNERIRLVFNGVSGLTINKTSKTIEHAFTTPGERRKGYGQSLLLIARLMFGNIRHSDYLTKDGEKFAKKG